MSKKTTEDQADITKEVYERPEIKKKGELKDITAGGTGSPPDPS
jgi:hypothetical protein